jgi:competence protein ComEA
LGPLIGLLLGLLVAGLVVLALQAPQGQEIAVLPPATPEPEATAGPVRVYVSGAVATPGVYALPAGSIAQDALALAGGPLADAALTHINLAQAVREGETLYVPRIGETAPAPTAPSPASPRAGEGGVGAGTRIDLNTATADQLDTLPKIGPATAQRIIAYREEHGGFKSVEEINEVSGIGDVTYGLIKDLLCVGCGGQ